MAADPYEVNWDFIRERMRAHRGGDSYRALSDGFSMLSAATCHRFLKRGGQLDLTSLLSVMSELNLRPNEVLIRRAKQMELIPERRLNPEYPHPPKR